MRALCAWLLLGTALAQPVDDERFSDLIEEESQVAAALDALDRQIADVVLSQNRAKLRRTEAAGAAQDLLDRLSTQQARVKTLRALVRDRLRVRHSRDPQAYLPVLLAATTVHQLVRRRGLINWIVRREVALLADLRAEERTLTDLVEQHDQAAAALSAAEAALVASRAELERSRALHAELLRTVRSERTLLAAAYAGQAAGRRELTDRLGSVGEIRIVGGLTGERGRLPRPVAGPVLVKFGEQVSLELGTQTFSNGWNIGAPFGAPVRAVYGGKVAYAGWYRGFGNLVIIEHVGEFFSLYAHLSSVSRGAGDTVEQGEVIGEVGDSGSLRGAQLYFELRQKRRALDPGVWLRPDL